MKGNHMDCFIVSWIGDQDCGGSNIGPVAVFTSYDEARAFVADLVDIDSSYNWSELPARFCEGSKMAEFGMFNEASGSLGPTNIYIQKRTVGVVTPQEALERGIAGAY